MLVAFEFQHVYPIYHPVRTTSLQSISCLSFECRKVLLHFLGYFSISNHSLIAIGIFENVEDFSFDSFRIKFQNNWTEWICLQRNCPRYKLSWCGRTKREWLKITAGWANVIQPLLEFVSNITGHVPNITGNETHLSIFELWWLVEPLTNFKPALSQIYLTILYYISTIHWYSIQQSGPKMVFDNRWSFLSNSQKTSKTHFF